MMQEINLYQPMFRKQKVIFSAVTMLQVGAFFLFIFLVIYVYQARNIKPYKLQLANVESELVQLSNQIVNMETKQSNKSKSKLLENEIAKLTKEFQQRERISEVLSNRSFGNASGFSTILESFARGHVKGTWLTNVNIKRGGTLLGLRGKTLSSELVPIYIQNLAKEKSLNGSTFNMMELALVESETGNSEINFAISTN